MFPLAAVNDAATNRRMHMPLWYTYFLSFVYMPSIKNAKSYGSFFKF